jgi:hypothetical protein
MGIGDRRAGTDDPGELLVVGDFPPDDGGSGGHAAAGFERAGREARPEDDGGGRGFTGGDAEGEGIGGEFGAGGIGGAGARSKKRLGGEGSRANHEAAAGEGGGRDGQFC